ncbi:sulfotransferase [Kordiimonas pumila]|uniref:Sulfotransferase n=1 Tax=Kordiimonas pumila TaxID=2161677 RepID=A0ABV7D7S9_9PROT|nr:sulfotransferase [Kordiimonas pumila]
MPSTPLIILGVHRSGTSMLTRMLEKLGVFVGHDLQGDHESRSFIQINNRYFEETKSSWDKPVYPKPSDLQNNIIKRVFEKNQAALHEHFGPMEGLWAFKDPRTVTTLPLWLDLFSDAKTIIIRRSPLASAKSLTSRHLELIDKGIFPAHRDFKKGRIQFTQRCATLNGSMEFVLEQLHFIHSMKKQGILNNYIEMSYEELTSDPVLHIREISRYLDLQFSKNQLFNAASLPRNVDLSNFETALKHYFVK